MSDSMCNERDLLAEVECLRIENAELRQQLAAARRKGRDEAADLLDRIAEDTEGVVFGMARVLFPQERMTLKAGARAIRALPLKDEVERLQALVAELATVCDAARNYIVRGMITQSSMQFRRRGDLHAQLTAAIAKAKEALDES